MNTPFPGDKVHMPWDGDVEIIVSEVPKTQQHRDVDIWTIIDQYGDEHVIEAEGESWIVLNEDAL